jgi:capsular exopolysaccharide synthesis family protein
MSERGIEAGEMRHFLDVLVRRQWVVYTVAGLVVCLACARAFTREPIYRATALLEIQRSGPDVLAFRDVVRTDPTYPGFNAFYETQFRIIQSRAVAQMAAERLALAKQPAVSQRPPGLLRRAASALRGLLPGRKMPAPAGGPLDPYIQMIQSGLDVRPVKDSNLVEVTYSAGEPRLAAYVANTVAEAYIEFTLTSQFDTTQEANDFLTRRVGDLREEVADLERQLQNYRESKQILPTSGSETVATKGLADLETLYNQARARRVERESRWIALRESDAYSLTDVLDNPSVLALQRDVNELEIRRAELLRTFKPGWPEVQALDRKLEGARARLEEEARRAMAAEEARYRVAREEELRLAKLLDEQRTVAHQLGRNTTEYATLQAEVERKLAVLNALLQRQNETAISSQLRDINAGNARIVDRAIPPAVPSEPRPAFEMALGLIIGLLLGAGAAFGLESWDNAVRTPEDVEKVLGLPTLARIPAASVEARDRKGPSHGGSLLDLMSHSSPGSPLAEAFRDLRTALSLSSAGRSQRLLAVTSTRPQEGKSTVALNLGIVLAQGDRKILLVDADLRRPRLHRAFGLRNGTGLTTVLCGKARLGEEIRPTTVRGLSLLSSGPIPPNPAEMLDSAPFGEILESLRASGWDTVIFDSAPLLTVADGAILASRVEGCLLVVESDATTRDEVHRAKEKLGQVSARLLGVVLNACEEPGGSHYGRYRYRYEPVGEEAPVDDQASPLWKAPARFLKRRMR